MRTLLSPPIEDFGPVPEDISADILTAAEEAISNPGFQERGRLSRRIASPERPDSTVLQQAWHRLVDYLVPPGATADMAKPQPYLVK